MKTGGFVSDDRSRWVPLCVHVCTDDLANLSGTFTAPQDMRLGLICVLNVAVAIGRD